MKKILLTAVLAILFDFVHHNLRHFCNELLINPPMVAYISGKGGRGGEGWLPTPLFKS